MKKLILLIISLLMMIPVTSHAQIEVRKRARPQILLEVGMWGVALMYHANDIYISIPSANQFDYNYVISLGKDIPAATKSVQILLEITDTITTGELYEFSSGKEEIRIYKGNRRGTIKFKADGYADFGYITKNELKQILNHLQSYK